MEKLNSLWYPHQGALPSASVGHALSMDPFFLHWFVTECPFFTTLHTQWPPIFALSIKKISGKIIKFKKFWKSKIWKKKKKLLKLPGVLQFHTQWPPFSFTQCPPPFCKKIVTVSSLICCVSRCTPISFTCECPPFATASWDPFTLKNILLIEKSTAANSPFWCKHLWEAHKCHKATQPTWLGNTSRQKGSSLTDLLLQND